MSSVNIAIIVGHVGREPEIRRTQAGKPVASFSVATSNRWKDKDTGDRKESTDWHNIVCFNEPLCEVIEKYVKKGSKIYIEGQMKTRKWESKGGEKHYSTEIVLQGYRSKLVLLDKSERRAPSEDDHGVSEPTEEHSGEAKRPALADDLADEIPF